VSRRRKNILHGVSVSKKRRVKNQNLYKKKREGTLVEREGMPQDLFAGKGKKAAGRLLPSRREGGGSSFERRDIRGQMRPATPRKKEGKRKRSTKNRS